MLGPLADSHHQGRRSRQSQCARTGDHQHGDHCQQPVGKRSAAAEDQPQDESQHRQCNHCRHEYSRNTVGDTLYRGFAALCLLHHADDLSEQRIATHFRRLQHECTALVDRPGQHRGPRLLLHRQRLAGNHALIDKRTARNHRPVDRDFLPGPHADTLSGL